MGHAVLAKQSVAAWCDLPDQSQTSIWNTIIDSAALYEYMKPGFISILLFCKLHRICLLAMDFSIFCYLKKKKWFYPLDGTISICSHSLYQNIYSVQENFSDEITGLYLG